MSLESIIKSCDVKIGVVGQGNVRLSLAEELTSKPADNIGSVTEEFYEKYLNAIRLGDK